MKRKLTEENDRLMLRGEDYHTEFDLGGKLFDLDDELPTVEKVHVNPDMLDAPQMGKTKRKMAQTDFAEETQDAPLHEESKHERISALFT